MQDLVPSNGSQPPDAKSPDQSPPARDFLRERTVKRELLSELRQSWQEGKPVPVNDLLERWPSDPAFDGDVACLQFEDQLQRTRVVGSSPAVDSDQTDPHHRSVAELVRHHEMLCSLGASADGDAYLRMPEVGEYLFGFDLRRELGRGAFARVFLATQRDLASRPVVLKVSRIEGTEPQTLAQLQHTNIVPIYSVHENERAGLRALCMPYFGGASLSEVLKNAWYASTRPQKGAELVQALDVTMSAAQGTSTELTPSPSEAAAPTEIEAQTPRALLAQLPYIHSVAWIVAALADGLAHAHLRGILHRDIKPSNILLATDGQPMLLDFNLALDASQANSHAVLGGTIAYMSPEHLRAMTSRGPGHTNVVDHSADIYSLGMVLYELLSGRSPFDQSASYTPLPMLVEAMATERGSCAPSLRKARPDVPWSLESIVRRCLAPDPAQRYERAEHLAEDLRCFLEDRTLCHAPELSLRERAQKWVRRHPRLSWTGTVAAISACVLLLTTLGLVSLWNRLIHTSDKLAVSHAEERKREFEEGYLLTLFYVNTKNELGDHLARGEATGRQTLNLYEVLDRPDWQEHPDWKRLPPQERTRLAENACDLLLLLAGARVRLARWDRETLLQALDLLDKAEQIQDVSPCQALWIDRAVYLQHLGDSAGASAAREHAATIPATTARDRYLLAMTCVREHKFSQAITHLNEAVRLNPWDYWSWMQRGLCHQELGETALAIGDFGTCMGLRPKFAWGYYNRGVALTAAGKRTEAISDYSQALEYDPELLAARLNSGVLHLELKQYSQALAALEKVEQAGRDDAALHSGLGIALEGLGRHKEADQAFARAEQRAQSERREIRQRIRRAYGFAVAERLPGQARAAFMEVLRESPADPEALYGCGMLCDRKGDQAEALRYFTRALDAAPAFEEARRFRAIVLARRGDYQAARLDINACLSKDSVSGATYYAAACVAALQAERENDPQKIAESTQEALEMLRAAFVRGYGLKIATKDQDLLGIHKHPEFGQLVNEFQVRSGSRQTSGAVLDTSRKSGDCRYEVIRG